MSKDKNSREHAAGKGDKPRRVDKKDYDKNYERIYGKEEGKR